MKGLFYIYKYLKINKFNFLIYLFINTKIKVYKIQY